MSDSDKGHGEESDQEFLTLRMGGKSGTTPLALVRLEVAGNTQNLTGVLRPDLPTTRIASQWSSALGLSAGGGAIAQILAGEEESWGPAELITPTVEDALNAQIDADGAGGLLLGYDLLHKVWVTYIGAQKLVILAYTVAGV